MDVNADIHRLGSFPDKLEQDLHLSGKTLRATLERRADLLRAIREYFYSQGVIEVETPLLYDYPVSDPHIQNLTVGSSEFVGRSRYLQSSPESSLKQLLSLGSGSIYQLAKVFRDDPDGDWHAQEFTMLEWYRVGYTLDQLREDISGFLKAVGFDTQPTLISSYQEVFERYGAINPFSASLEDLQKAVHSLEGDFGEMANANDKNLLIDLLMSHCVQPKLGQHGFEFLCDYPADQAALAEVATNKNGAPVARRFELFYGGVELANAYQELCDPQEFVVRHQADNETRRRLGQPVREIDQGLLRAMQRGVPACAGVALGVDRLLALLCLLPVDNT